MNLIGLKNKHFNGIQYWAVMFLVIIWQNGKERNKETIAKEKLYLLVSSKNIMEYAKGIKWDFEHQKTIGMENFNSKVGGTN